MSSSRETQASFDDVVEDAAPSFPMTVASKFATAGKDVIARAFRVDGGGDITIKTAAGQSRTLTAVEDPFFVELKITEITDAPAVTKVRFYV